MPRSSAARLLVPLTLALVAACSDSATAPTSAAPSLTPPMAPSAIDSPAPDPNVAALEVDYMSFSVDHHEGGKAMARLCIARATHTELRELCEKNLADQSREQQEQLAWLREWYGISKTPMIMPDVQADIARLSRLSGHEFEIDFMQTFSAHHKMIIESSRPVAAHAFHQPLRDMAARVIRAQTEDIKKMQSWLCHWYEVCVRLI